MKNFIKVLLIILLFIFMIYIFHNFIWLRYQRKHGFEKSNIEISEGSQNSPFSISKVIVYSSAYGENKNTTFQQSNWILNIFQYSDIAIYIENKADELNTANTVKKLYLENLSISTPALGSPSLYYLDSLNFGTPNRNENYKIDDSIEFTVLNDTNETNTIQYNTPVFFTDCSNPITLKYVNSSIKENFTIFSNEPVFFNGKLLEMAGVELKDLETIIRFRIHVVNYENEDFYYDLSLPMPFENETNSVLERKYFGGKKF